MEACCCHIYLKEKFLEKRVTYELIRTISIHQYVQLQASTYSLGDLSINLICTIPGKKHQYSPHYCTNFLIDSAGKQKYDSQPFLLSDRWGWICAAFVAEG
jgi:hypothetical protein